MAETGFDFAPESGTQPADQGGLFPDSALPVADAPAPFVSYNVLARKYRPAVFEDLIGQDAMVRTLKNAFDSGRIPQAWILTGVRGIGKTTTARILARGLNYQKADGSSGGPTVHMPEFGIHCKAILESRHMDVIEIDAASFTGVDDIREITDNVRYMPATARFKVYIIDEVHMLSKNAFNAFLKTLEEPPPHAKFIMATTDIQKVPVTVLSRCQRFDLRRVEGEKIIAHLSRICEAEQVKAEPEALVAIARASEGSVRDSLSLLDQAIAYEAGTVTAEGVRNMLGLADRAQVMDLFEAVMKGDLVSSFKLLGEQHDLGADPDKVLREMARVTHLVTRLKVIPKAAADRGLTEDERLRGKTLADKLSVRALSQTWQILLKGVDEVTMSGQPLIAAEMVLVRLAYAADLPTPDEALRTLRNMPQATASAPPVASAPPASAPRAAALPPVPAAVGGNLAVVTPRAEPGPTLSLRSFEDVVALAAEKREIVLKTALENDVHLVRFEDGKIEFSLEDGANRSLPNDLARLLDRWTGKRWVVALSREAGQPTIRQRRDADRQELRTSLEQHPLVQSVLRSFPGAKIVDVRSKADKAAEADDEVDVEVDAGVTAGTDDDDADMSEPVM